MLSIVQEIVVGNGRCWKHTFSGVRYMLSPVRLTSVYLSSVTFVHSILSRLNVLALFLRYLIPWPFVDVHEKFYGNRLRGTPPSGVGPMGVNARG